MMRIDGITTVPMIARSALGLDRSARPSKGAVRANASLFMHANTNQPSQKSLTQTV